MYKVTTSDGEEIYHGDDYMEMFEAFIHADGHPIAYLDDKVIMAVVVNLTGA